MSESPDNIIREYIDFVNKQVGVYMDALAGFTGHHVRIERQVHRISKATNTRIDKNGQQVIIRTSYEDPSKPDVIHNRIIRANDYIAANSEGGSNAQQISQAILVFLYTYWEDEIRPRLATSKSVNPSDISSDIMGDLRILRNVILHSKGIIRLDKYKSLKKLKDIFTIDKPVHVSYENMHQIFVLIKQVYANMLFEWLGVKDAPINPDEIVDIAIQRNYIKSNKKKPNHALQ